MTLQPSEAQDPHQFRESFEIVVDGAAVVVADGSLTLLDVLREQLGVRSVKDGCSPQGQCGCCTVLVDGQPRVACVTPARRVQGRTITTLEGLGAEVRDGWARAFAATGASQCGFCTPGIICRFAGLHGRGADHRDRRVAARTLAAHLCRCTGWQPILDAWQAYPGLAATAADAASAPDTDQRAAADLRATIEGHTRQSTGPHVSLGAGGFADDTAPAGALVAVRAGPDCEAADEHGWVVAETAAEARSLAGQVPGRRTTARWAPPLEVPPGDWAVTLRTSWVEPGYLETDAAWCRPGGEPASALGNGGAFGGKLHSPVVEAARLLAARHGRPVRVLWSRPDTVELGPKRPPIAAGLRPDGTGGIVVARTPGIAAVIQEWAPGLVVTEVDVPGPPTSSQVRGAGWAEAAVLLAAARGEPGWIAGPDGGSATAAVAPDGTICVEVRAGRTLDETVLRSYCTGAAHMAYSWVTSESLGVDPDGHVHDLTVRSFGIVGAADMPAVEVEIIDDGSEPVNGSDAVFAAVAAAVWIDRGCPSTWPTGSSTRA
ncbi:MAG: 2Fe-2S iron-sulfur cluster binding domain-containing protein [Acidimicrobiaceae bacterium]|nr:2Fe-2S iron-sulfur cluster binding domain-containing protein [Acidimicrobiaceae bacterium]MXZ98031.1 2Fe-2S iron-sulfur cluster binding domain-containing protein [Acidimicrobiaceae bacterium]MYE75765.1 2Fe-2S iron-sulfur cluster binding domain-containing protein [Acidimicrobiaceae bacterium]MYE96370.1 2Fe-2S iron-sulfur cluster binding domain-containing protein [Acidimicrobiaceae bacterium]MYH44237.1 2Fe-2S iron-sulfur cluster binding domain-containing protein [Acidimicrobiaceae bacterium]